VPELTPVEPEILEWLRQASTATITTQLFQRGLRNLFLNGLLPLNPGHCRFVGEAVTLRNIPMRRTSTGWRGSATRSTPSARRSRASAPGRCW
jgi:regulator of RNase E activity RraA